MGQNSQGTISRDKKVQEIGKEWLASEVVGIHAWLKLVANISATDAAKGKKESTEFRRSICDEYYDLECERVGKKKTDKGRAKAQTAAMKNMSKWVMAGNFVLAIAQGKTDARSLTAAAKLIERNLSQLSSQPFEVLSQNYGLIKNANGKGYNKAKTKAMIERLKNPDTTGTAAKTVDVVRAGLGRKQTAKFQDAYIAINKVDKNVVRNPKTPEEKKATNKFAIKMGFKKDTNQPAQPDGYQNPTPTEDETTAAQAAGRSEADQAIVNLEIEKLQDVQFFTQALETSATRVLQNGQLSSSDIDKCIKQLESFASKFKAEKAKLKA